MIVTERGFIAWIKQRFSRYFGISDAVVREGAPHNFWRCPLRGDTPISLSSSISDAISVHRRSEAWLPPSEFLNEFVIIF